MAISKIRLLDKIKGGWTGQVVGCTYSGPTEFRFQSTFIHDYQPLSWSRDALPWFFENIPGLYDDIYMDLTFVGVIEEKGLDAPPEAFAKKFAQAGYMLWHANQMARYNILNGIAPPQSGHWLNNPHADDIDFQIEADFAGLMSPGMANAAAGICDRVGHIMNYGDGYYGGLYVAAMYSLAFIENDVHRLVEEALRIVPEQSLYARTIRTVIEGYRENPQDWRETWFRVQKNWGEDIGCPDGVFDPFNIDARINSAWVVMGLLYGEGDFGRTIEISARAGDDSDCNPATAGGILGTVIGYERIPDFWKQGLAAVEGLDFKYTTISLTEASGLSFKHALEMIKKNGGKVDSEDVRIKTQKPEAGPLEVGFAGHFPKERRQLDICLNGETREAEFAFEGIGFVVNGAAEKIEDDLSDAVLELEVRLDEDAGERILLPTADRVRKPTPFWRYQLNPGQHRVRVNLLNPAPGVELWLSDVVIYGAPPSPR
ncbi:MAG: ADP-ribosylglycohydrolase family protein [Candidatus Aminicenantales bacterium]